ncbi:hypothetical protein [Delftia sp. WSY_22]|uniref:hypothetical protein n=1 Tax=Delftia sp. WSY_22 TaxID=3367213 RepID=UPI00370A0561
MVRRKKRTDYEFRTDIQKIESQWIKLSGLHGQDEWSAVVLRAATAAEIAANFVIRQEFRKLSKFSPEFVDKLLVWANGLDGKMNKLILPMMAEDERLGKFKELSKIGASIFAKRNKIAHQGVFTKKKESEIIIADCKKFVEEMVGFYEEDFMLSDKSAE